MYEALTSILCFLATAPSVYALSNPPLSLRTSATILEHGVANIYVSYNAPIDRRASLQLTYGSCSAEVPDDAHHIVGRADLHQRADLPDRLVWFVNEDTPATGCLSAWLDTALVGRSSPLTVGPKIQKRGKHMSDFDATGLWFDGVTYLKQKEPDQVFVAKAKSTKIAIVGAGMSGLMTSLLLDSVGLHNYEIIEASQRFGGRVHTEYLEGGPDDYQYQEMGPMRFPRSIQYAGTNETLVIKDHQLVFQLADELNAMNNNSANLTVNFIPWIQSMPGDLSYTDGIKTADGRAPNLAQIAANPSLAPSDPNPVLQEANAKLGTFLYNTTRIAAYAANVYQAHHDAIADGEDDWSEFTYIHNTLGYDLNITDNIAGADPAATFWEALYELPYFAATNWSTIDKGLNRLPEAFWGTRAANRTIMNRKIYKLDSTPDGKVQLFWKPNSTASSRTMQSATYDYAIVTAPFSVVRLWRLPRFSSILSRAISHLSYVGACKVALQFKTRFWEHFAQPILGGCSSTDIFGIGSTCYPSYKLNSSGPGVMLASYTTDNSGDRLISQSPEQHVQYVIDAMAEMHGDIVYDQYTGKSNRRCWGLDEFESGSWASPSVGQHKLFIPSYYKTEHNTIFIGEHTSFTHAWIASALESAIRGTVQLCLELGLVDEAKEITKKWMGRWVTV